MCHMTCQVIQQKILVCHISCQVIKCECFVICCVRLFSLEPFMSYAMSGYFFLIGVSYVITCHMSCHVIQSEDWLSSRLHVRWLNLKMSMSYVISSCSTPENCQEKLSNMSSYVSVCRLALVIESVNIVLFHVLPIISHPDVPPCYDARLSSIFSLGLFLPLILLQFTSCHNVPNLSLSHNIKQYFTRTKNTIVAIHKYS